MKVQMFIDVRDQHEFAAPAAGAFHPGFFEWAFVLCRNGRIRASRAVYDEGGVVGVLLFDVKLGSIFIELPIAAKRTDDGTVHDDFGVLIRASKQRCERGGAKRKQRQYVEA